jgi:hypothetical protein
MTVEDFATIGDRLTAALLSGDIGLYRQVMVLPLWIEPYGDPAYVLETDAALALDFQLYVTALRAAGITDIWREVRAVTTLADGTARVHCRVHLMAHAYRVTEPFASEMWLRPHGGSFRIARIVATAGHIDWTLGKAPLGPAGGLM